MSSEYAAKSDLGDDKNISVPDKLCKHSRSKTYVVNLGCNREVFLQTKARMGSERYAVDISRTTTFL